MLSYQCFVFRSFGIEKKVNNLLQFLEVMDSFEVTSLTVVLPILLKIDTSHALTYLHDKDGTYLFRYGTCNIHFKQNKSIHFSQQVKRTQTKFFKSQMCHVTKRRPLTMHDTFALQCFCLFFPQNKIGKKANARHVGA